MGAFARLHERENIEFALFGGRPPARRRRRRRASCPFPHRHVRPHELARSPRAGATARSSAPTGGRVALLATLGGRAARARAADPVGLAVGAPAQRRARAQLPARCARLYRSADAVVTYGPHVSAYVRARGARNVHVAPQSVDNDFWSAPDVDAPRGAAAGPPGARHEVPVCRARRPGKGSRGAVGGLACIGPSCHRRRARPRRRGIQAPSGPRRRRGGVRTRRRRLPGPGPARSCATCTPPATCWSCRRSATRTFREPWGLVVNEAMNQRPAGDRQRRRRRRRRRPGARRRQRPGRARRRQRRARRRDARGWPPTPRCARAWARPARRTCAPSATTPGRAGFSRALASLGLSRERW